MAYLNITSFFRGVIFLQCMLIASVAFADEMNYTTIEDIRLDSTITYIIDTIQHPTCADSLGGSIQITPDDENAIYIYEWKKNTTVISTEQDIDGLSAGIYTLTIQDPVNNCMVVDMFILSLMEAIELQIDSTNSCFGANNGTAVVIVTDTTGNYTYSWSNSITTASIVDLSPDTYSLTVTSEGGCIAIDSVTIEELAPIKLDIDLIPTTCYGNSNGVAIATVIGDTITDNYTYLWSNGVTIDTAINLIPDSTYYITVTDNLECMTMDSVLITQPDSISFTLNATSAGCSGSEGMVSVDSLSGGTGNYTFSWSHDDMLTESIASDLLTGTYNVTVTDDNACTNTNSIMVEGFDAIELSSTSTPVTCFGDSNGTAMIIIDNAMGNYTFSWSHDITLVDNVATNLYAGTYMVTVTDSNDCMATIPVEVVTPAIITFNTDSTDVSCFEGNNGTASVINVSGGTDDDYTYQWDDVNMQTESMAIDLIANTYDVTVTDTNGCTATSSIDVNQPDQLPPPVLEPQVVFQNNTEEELTIESDALELYWMVFGTENINTTAPSYLSSGTSQNDILNLIYTLADSRAPGQVILNVSSQDGICTGEPATVTIQIFPDGGLIFIPEVFSPNSDGINDEWEIHFDLRDNPSDYAIKIFSRNGQKVYEASSITDFWDAEGYPDGAYYYIIMDKTNNTQYKGTISVVRK